MELLFNVRVNEVFAGFFFAGASFSLVLIVQVSSTFSNYTMPKVVLKKKNKHIQNGQYVGLQFKVKSQGTLATTRIAHELKNEVKTYNLLD